MAIRCDDCRYLFSKKRVSCPFCGGQTIRDDRPDADLLAAGYTMAPQGRQQTIPDDPFEAMLRAYQEEQTQPIPTPPAAEPSQPEQPQDGVDFFSHFQGGSPAADIPTVESTRRSQPQQEPPRRQPTQPDPYEAELREIERQQRRLERQYRRGGLLGSSVQLPLGVGVSGGGVRAGGPRRHRALEHALHHFELRPRPGHRHPAGRPSDLGHLAAHPFHLSVDRPFAQQCSVALAAELLCVFLFSPQNT